MITLASGSSASSDESVARPSSGSLGRGGSPRSSSVTEGRLAVNAATLPARSPAMRHLVIRRERPLHLRADVLVVFHDEERRFRHCVRCTGKLARNVVPFADFAFDLHAAAVRLDDRAGLKQADAEAFLLRALKRPKQATPSRTPGSCRSRCPSRTERRGLPRCSVRT